MLHCSIQIPSLVAIFVCVFLPASTGAADRVLKAEFGGRPLSGLILADRAADFQLLASDGQIRTLPKNKLVRPQVLSTTFAASAVHELKQELKLEFGRGFDVTGTGHYLVVHPTGQRDQWAARFEEIYRSFRWYFQVRGFPLQSPKFTLVAVVFPTQADFQRYAAQRGVRINSNVLGYYDPTTNRVLMYDFTAGQKNGAAWQTNADTVIHEVTHQMAFNSGVHSRFGQPPKWVVEGLATLFEAPGVWNGLKQNNAADRVNRAQLAQFRASLATRRKGALLECLSGDRGFQTKPADAYAEAWAMSHYLTETNPKGYARYLQLTGASRNKESSSAERVKEFSSVFGADLAIWEGNFLRFMSEIR